MPKIKITVENSTRNFDIDMEKTDTPQIECSLGSEILFLSFTSENYRNYYNRIPTVATDQQGREIGVVSLAVK